MHTCMCACKQVCLCVWGWVCIHVCMCVCMWLGGWVCMHAHKCVHVRVCVCVCVCVCVLGRCLYVHACMCVCAHSDNISLTSLSLVLDLKLHIFEGPVLAQSHNAHHHFTSFLLMTLRHAYPIHLIRCLCKQTTMIYSGGWW